MRGNSTAKPVFMNRHVVWVVLVVGLAITAAATSNMKSSIEVMAEKDFADHCGEIQAKISDRMEEHVRILQSGADFLMPQIWLHAKRGGSIRNVR